MKTLLILRHAKSSWKHLELVDHDRPLNKRGKRDAPYMGKLLRYKNLIPDMILSSTAMRALSTAEAVAKVCGYKGEITLTSSFYQAGPEAYMEVLRRISDDCRIVLVVGHNPGLEELIEMLTGEVRPMQTCTLSQVNLFIRRWEALNSDTKGKLIMVLQPRDVA
jgi:phosphohistidine phosphatase